MSIPLAYWQRHVGSLLKYGSAGKVANLARACYHYRRGSTYLPSMPSFLKIEISRRCGVKCKYCPGALDDRYYPLTRDDDVFYPFERYRDLVDRLKKHLFLVSLYDIGEPLANPDAPRYIRYAHEQRIGTVVSSSLSIHRSDGFWRHLVGSGLDKLIVALDGTTQEVYSEYRTHGDLDLAMSNLRKILAFRQNSGRGPSIEWQMLDLPSNKSQQADARAMALRMGCDHFRLITEAAKKRSRYEKENVTRSRNCLLPYVIFIVNAHNDARPCYKIYNVPMAVGSLEHSTFEEIWNSPEMAAIRDACEIRRRQGCMTCQE